MRRSSAFAWYRLAIVGVVVLLAIVATLYVRGPIFWQRHYYPLRFQKQIAASSARHKLNPYLVAAVINAESKWDTGVVSRAGAVGLMQVLPDTARELARSGRVDSAAFPATKLSDPAVNIEYGTAYLRYLVERYHEVETALAAYNAGLRHADTWKAEGGNIRDAIAFPETKQYVLKVVRGRDRYLALYPHAFPEWKGQ